MAEQPKQQKPTNQPNQPNKQPKRSRWAWLYYVVMIGLMVLLFYPTNGSVDKDLSYTKFTAYINNDAVASVVVYDDNTVEAKIRPENYALVFGNQEAGEEVKGELKSLIPSVDEFAKFIDNVNIQRKEQGKAAIDVSYAKSKNHW